MDQVPHRPRLGHRHGDRRAADRPVRDVGRIGWPGPVRRRGGGRPGHRPARRPAGARWRSRDRHLLPRPPVAARRRQHDRPGDLADRRRLLGPTGRPGHDGPSALVQGRDHDQGEHPARVGLRGDHGHRRPRRADAGQLRRRHRRPARPGVGPLPAMAATGPVRGHGHRIRLRRRHPLDPGGRCPPSRAAGGGAGRLVRHLPGPCERHRWRRYPGRAGSGRAAAGSR